MPVSALVESHTSPRVLICTGFHRSATSATALQLAEAGLPMGNRLMGGSISNPLGFGEDLSAVELHDSLLQANSTDWQYAGEGELKVASSRALEHYVQLRDSSLARSRLEELTLAGQDAEISATSWGLKDPRACLFLESWHQLLGARGAYLFVLRHWSASIESLLTRSSRELAHNLLEPSLSNQHLKFWQKPELAAKMWLSYCKRMLNFAKRYPAQTLLVTQRALFEGAPLVSELNTRFELGLNESSKSVLKTSLLRDEASEHVVREISESLRYELDLVWQELLALADFKSEDELPIYHPIEECSAGFIARYQQATRRINTENAPVLTEQQRFAAFQKSINALTAETSVLELLQSHTGKFSSECHSDICELVHDLTTRFSLSGELMLQLARWLQRQGLHQKALHSYQESLALGLDYPHIYLSIGNCYQSLGDHSKALQCYQQAIDKNPNNPQFYVAKAQLMRAEGRIDEALVQFNSAYIIGPQRMGVILPYCDLLIQLNQLDEAKGLIDRFESKETNPWLERLNERILFLLDSDHGKRHYAQLKKRNLAVNDKFEWLAQTSVLISASSSEADFLRRVEGHWLEFAL
ncbi:tetratricopeptide repeat protein [uncultured Umboniibacter sp.]|uniref:tetratricopeptide repeat protein n=1 Tax=uncultured Umboniibacter sp. TaxID=1798917 RepID=UPI002634C235|nr:tetratricopeptide repeat protein [uncultured Umboniibacter sp.]